MHDEDDGTPFWLSPWPFLEPQYLGGPVPPVDDED